MNIIKKLNHLGIGVITEENVSPQNIAREIGKLYKRPFWSLGAGYYGAAASLCRGRKVDGIIYLSSFSCGIDSVVTELIKNEVGDFPYMVLKFDEHTGEAGVDTRIEAFSDMLKRRARVDCNLSSYGQHVYSGKSAI
jgi:predicted nucleotide-binding protein (sugar kinase/HSP70/actin superfamily)